MTLIMKTWRCGVWGACLCLLGHIPPAWAADPATTLGTGPSTELRTGTFEDGRAAYAAKDYARALNILQPLAESGNAQAQLALGVMYDHGEGVPRDNAAAIAWYKKAAAQGIPAVQHDLGVKYYNGAGVAKDPAEAVKWWRLAADNGLPDSQYNLGLMYARGSGVGQDDQAALQWFEKAAAQGHALGQYSLGAAYALGKGTATDYQKAAEWFRKSAEQGTPQAQYNLGVLLENGQGVTADAKQAREWYKKAAAQGLEAAKQKLATATSTAHKATAGGTPHGEDWIAAQNPQSYTIQLVASSNEDNLLKLLKHSSLPGEAAYFRNTQVTPAMYIALCGVYARYDDAQAAMTRLPPDLRQQSPWVRKFATVQALIGKH